MQLPYLKLFIGVSARVLLGLNWAADAVEKDDTAKVLIITGVRAEGNNDPAREAFCSGGYFNPAELESMDKETKVEGAHNCQSTLHTPSSTQRFF